MPMTNYICPNCQGNLHSDDLLEGECVTPGCGHDLAQHHDRDNGVWELPRDPEAVSPGPTGAPPDSVGGPPVADVECPDCGHRMLEVDPPETPGPQSWECPECCRHVDANGRGDPR